MTTLTQFLSQARAKALSLMVDTCVVYRQGDPQPAPDTGADVPTRTEVWSGPCRVQTAGGFASQSSDSGDGSLGQRVMLWSLQLHLPITAMKPRSGDVAVVTASRDPQLVGCTYRLLNLQSEKTNATARRWNVEELERTHIPILPTSVKIVGPDKLTAGGADGSD